MRKRVQKERMPSQGHAARQSRLRPKPKCAQAQNRVGVEQIVGLAVESRLYLRGRDGLEACLPTMREVAGDFDGVRRAAEVRIYPVGTCRQHGMGGIVLCGEAPRA